MARIVPKYPVPHGQSQQLIEAAGGISGLHDNLSPSIRALRLLSEVSNLTGTGLAAATTRPGRAMVGTAAVGTTPVLGLGELYTSGGVRKLVSGAGTVWKVYNSGTKAWDNLKTGLTANKPFQTCMFNDWLIIANGSDPPQKYTGSAISALGGSPPVSPLCLSAYRRVFLVTLPHLVRVSASANAEEWVNPDASFLPVNDKDGDAITWLHLYHTNVIIFKRHSLHELHGPELGLDPMYWRVLRVHGHGMGTPNGRTVQEIDGAMYWLSDSGIVRWTGGQPQIISQPVSNTLARINWSYISTACSGTDGNGRYLLSLPLDTATEPSATLEYSTRHDTWWLWEGWSPQVWSTFRFSQMEESIMGDSDGAVYTLGGDTDNGVGINGHVTFGPSMLGNTMMDKFLGSGYFALSASNDVTSITVQMAPSDTAAFGAARALSPVANAASGRQRCMLPVGQGQQSRVFAPRTKIAWEGGTVTLYDYVLEYEVTD